MGQSNAIFGFLAAAFLVFITQRGELRTYLGFILSAPPSNAAPSGITTSTGNMTNTADSSSASSAANAATATQYVSDAFALFL